MEIDQSRKALVKQFINTWSSHNPKRCDRCGRRLKFHTGAWLGGSYERYLTCRSCGYENPSLWEKVGQDLIAAGWSLNDFPSAVEPLPQCMGCGVYLLVSGDFTKVFCYGCGREWDRFDIEEMLGQPLDPRLAGRMPFPMDESPIADELTAVLDRADIDYGTPYFVARLESESQTKSPGFLKAMKQGWDQERGNRAEASSTNREDKGTNRYTALFEDYLAVYTVSGEETSVLEFPFDDYLVGSEPQPIDPGFTMVFAQDTILRVFNERLSALRMIHRANATRYTPVLFGEASRQQDSSQPALTTETSLASELERLAALRMQGLLDDAEFAAAKQRLLGSVARQPD